jgi:DNA-binding NarL/FixJ family response regulator
MTFNANASRHVLYVCQEHIVPTGIDSLMEQLSTTLDVAFLRVPSIRSILETVVRVDYEIDLIILDVDTIINEEQSSVFDIVNTITTLLRYHKTRPSNPLPNASVPIIAIGVGAHTPPKAIRELLTVTNISGLYPGGFEFSLDEKITAVRELLLGNQHVPKSIKQLLVGKPKPIGSEVKQPLTTRQAQILDIIVSRGASNKTIANILHITDSTVKLHMTAILKKCGVRSRTQLVAFHLNKT